MSLTAAVPPTPTTPKPPAASMQDRGGRPRRWTRDEYYRAITMGLFPPEERLELIEGEIIQKVAENAPHATALDLSVPVLTQAFAGQQCYLRIQHPITLDGDSDPEPDIAVVSGAIRDYETRHPGAENLLLVVEISNTTLAFDRNRKAALYAAAGIREYWIVNLIDRCLEVYRGAVEDVYPPAVVQGEAETVSPLFAPQAAIRVADLLPSKDADEA